MFLLQRRAPFQRCVPRGLVLVFQATGKRVLPRSVCPYIPLSCSVPETADRAGPPRVREVHAGDCVHFIIGHAVLCPIILGLCCWRGLVLRRPLLVLLGRPCTCVLNGCFVLPSHVRRRCLVAFPSRVRQCMLLSSWRRGGFVDLVLHTRLVTFLCCTFCVFCSLLEVVMAGHGGLYFVMGLCRKEDGSIVMWVLCTS